MVIGCGMDDSGESSVKMEVQEKDNRDHHLHEDGRKTNSARGQGEDSGSSITANFNFNSNSGTSVQFHDSTKESRYYTDNPRIGDKRWKSFQRGTRRDWSHFTCQPALAGLSAAPSHLLPLHTSYSDSGKSTPFADAPGAFHMSDPRIHIRCKALCHL